MIRLLFTYLTVFILGSGFKIDHQINENLRNHSNQAFTFGEHLRYRVHYGWINAASIDIKVGDKPKKVNGRTTYNIKAYGKTYRSFDWAYISLAGSNRPETNRKIAISKKLRMDTPFLSEQARYQS